MEIRFKQWGYPYRERGKPEKLMVGWIATQKVDLDGETNEEKSTDSETE